MSEDPAESRPPEEETQDDRRHSQELVRVHIVLDRPSFQSEALSLQSTASSLASLGVQNLNRQRLQTFMLASCDVPGDQIEAIRALPGVSSVEPDQKLKLLDEDEPPGSSATSSDSRP